MSRRTQFIEIMSYDSTLDKDYITYYDYIRYVCFFFSTTSDKQSVPDSPIVLNFSTFQRSARDSLIEDGYPNWKSVWLIYYVFMSRPSLISLNTIIWDVCAQEFRSPGQIKLHEAHEGRAKRLFLYAINYVCLCQSLAEDLIFGFTRRSLQIRTLDEAVLKFTVRQSRC